MMGRRITFLFLTLLGLTFTLFAQENSPSEGRIGGGQGSAGGCSCPLMKRPDRTLTPTGAEIQQPPQQPSGSPLPPDADTDADGTTDAQDPDDDDDGIDDSDDSCPVDDTNSCTPGGSGARCLVTTDCITGFACNLTNNTCQTDSDGDGTVDALDTCPMDAENRCAPPPTTCGNGTCDTASGESTATCPADCPSGPPEPMAGEGVPGALLRFTV
ncbi:MAG: hypothetical protein HY542_01125, partial [Deltaproteobacteria bacterium]|nr:hypothetical protein [Deltaproteobacteria bacterium]